MISELQLPVGFQLELLFLLPLAFLLWHLFIDRSRRRPLPPSPCGLPLIGNVFQAPSSREWETYARWGQEYGDIMSISIFGKNTIILNSLDIAIEMLDAKGAIYSERQLTPMLKLSGWSGFLTFTNTGKIFRQQRSLIHRLVGTPSTLGQFNSLIEDENYAFLRRVLNSPEELADHIRLSAGSLILRITYGYVAREWNDPFISLAEKSLKNMSLASAPATWIVDFFPSMSRLPSWLPGIGFQKFSNRWFNDTQELLNAPYEFVKEQMAAGAAMPSFASALIEGNDLAPEEVQLIKWLLVVVYMGGADTTVSMIRGFFLAMVLYPEVLKKAQAEIDVVVGSQRLPLISDRKSLPYVNAVIREVLRWNVVGPTAIPHISSQDDIHAGYLIPKGSVIVPNVYFMLKDPRIYRDPERFNPERFLGEKPERDPRQMAFGFGRRICPGRFFAEEVIFIACATSIAVFDIQKRIKDGVVIEPVYRMTPGFISHPEPYIIDVMPRSDKARSLINLKEDHLFQ